MPCISKSDIILLLDYVLHHVRNMREAKEAFDFITDIRNDLEYAAWEEVKYRLRLR